MSLTSFAAFVDEVEPAAGATNGAVLFRPAKPALSRRDDAMSIAEREVAAYERGITEGQRLTRVEIEQISETHQFELYAAIEAGRRLQIDADGTMLASRLDSAFAELEVALIDKVQTVLQGWLEAAVIERALNELGTILRRAIATDGALEMTIYATADLVEAVKKQLPAGWDRAKFIAAEGPSIQIVAGSVDISVDLGAWRSQIVGGGL
jgi:hypothetical protein